MAKDTYALVKATRIDTDCERIYKAPDWTVDVGDIVEVETNGGTCFAIVTGLTEYTTDKDNAFWFDVLDIDKDSLKKVLRVGKMRDIEYEVDE